MPFFITLWNNSLLLVIVHYAIWGSPDHCIISNFDGYHGVSSAEAPRCDHNIVKCDQHENANSVSSAAEAPPTTFTQGCDFGSHNFANCDIHENVNPSFYFREQSIEDLLDVNLWLALCPFLSIGGNKTTVEDHLTQLLLNSKTRRGWSEEKEIDNNNQRQHSLNNDGYFRLSNEEVDSPIDISERLAIGVKRLVAHGYPPTGDYPFLCTKGPLRSVHIRPHMLPASNPISIPSYPDYQRSISVLAILMYDESWLLGDLIRSHVKPASRNDPINDYYVFLVDPGSSGSPSNYTPGPAHRDRPSGDASSFRTTTTATTMSDEVGLDVSVDVAAKVTSVEVRGAVTLPAICIVKGEPEPKYCSVWMALTDATPENSCLYVVPRTADSGYHGCGDAIEPYNVQNIVCQPILQGGLIVFSHRLLHWGSNPLAAAVAVTVTPPVLPLGVPIKRIRIAFSCAFADQTYEESYFDNNLYLPFPPLALRLGLISGQQIQYAHLVPHMTKEEIKLHQRIFCSQKQYFAEKYYTKTTIAAQFLIFKKSQAKAKSRN